MSFLLKPDIHGSLVDVVYNEILSRRSNYYYFIGRVVEWDEPSSPPAPVATGDYEYQTRNDIISVERIPFTDVSYVVRRRDWVSGTVYDQWDPNYSVSDPAASGATIVNNSLFYILTTDFNVYKCLYNNNGASSTIQPSGTEATPITLGDGYVWKYLYTIPLALRTKFLTSTYMPVQRAVYAPFYSNGEIDRIIIDNRGAGYNGNAVVTLSVVGTFNGGAGNSIANIIPIFNTEGQIVDVVIRDRGNNYNNATISITVNDGVGSGRGYYNPAGTANLIPILANTQLDRVLIDDPGIDYSSNITTDCILVGDGANARLIPFVNESGEVEEIIIQNRGEGYSYLDIEIVGDGTGANAYAELSSGDLDTTQATVELSAIDGAIYNIKILTPGDGYDSANIVVTGDGSGFIGNVVISNSNTIASVTIINPGQSYTFANVEIVSTGSNVGANATASAIISPYGGHGKNAVKELYSDTLMFYSTINNERIHGVDVNNDYRQFGIIRNLQKFNSEQVFANTFGTPSYLVTAIQPVGTLSRDDELYVTDNGKRTFEVIEVLPATNQLLLTDKTNYNLGANVVLTANLSGSSYEILAVNATPTINKFSGELLFIDNRTSVSYSDEQLVTLRTVIKF